MTMGMCHVDIDEPEQFFHYEQKERQQQPQFLRTIRKDGKN
jgi:hypothetical protein